MEKLEKIVVVLLLMAFASLFVAYVTFLPADDTVNYHPINRVVIH